MALKWQPTLRDVFALSLLGLLLGLALLFYLALHGSEQTILHSSERYRDLAAGEVAQRVTDYLNEAPLAANHFEREVRFGLIDPMDADSVGRGLFSLLLANQNISEAALTYGSRGLPANPALSGQIAVLRSAKAGEFVRKRTWFEKGAFVSASDAVREGSQAPPLSLKGAHRDVDPAGHPTFQGAVRNYGRLISTDLHWSQIDESLPKEQRRVEVSVQRTIEDFHGRFAGVLRIGLMKAQIDGAVRQRNDPHRIFLCDNQGRLITGFGDHARVAVSGDDLRIAPENAPPEVAQALREPVLKTVGDDRTLAATSFNYQGKVYFCTFKSLPRTQDWIVGIVVPRDFYLGQLVRIRNRVLWALLGLIVALVAGGGLVLRSVVRAQGLILRETGRMNDFQFSPAANSSYLRDVKQVLAGLERAKTAMRAMSKYVPVNLVRQLYRAGQEPVLGGRIAELSVLFTDIKDFTAFAEELPPDQLAEILGRYLQTMAGVIQKEKGTIDKYIGDAVMAFWNAPDPVANHETAACRAALGCREAAPGFETRFGLHRCHASVGHFGAPDRFNYTAIGDGINLASRLEGLNKYYGTTIIASESIRAAAEASFEFRLLDRVAVKGRTQGIAIYELLRERQPGTPRPGFVERYEEAFALYQRADFGAALALLETQPDDKPGEVLAGRCRNLKDHPPGDWDGVRQFDSK